MEQDFPALTEQEKKIILWRLEVLTKAGIEPLVAGAIAAIGNLDLHEAERLKRKGCPDKLLYELLR